MIRTRIAPSPTGDPHIGTAYIALFNYAFAKSQNGQFICRIEDTDRIRSKNYFETALINAFDWLDLKFDAVYRQSDRLDIYQNYIKNLLNKGVAYYDNGCIRLKSQHNEISFDDELRGKITISDYQKDPVLIKSDGWPTYHFANVIDDHLMNITHVIRGEEWIISTPIHVELYREFDWEIPKFYHLSLLRNQDRSKLSKRKNPTSLLYYKNCGYLPQALMNYLSTLGYYHSNNDIFSLDEMILSFDWKKVSINGPIFDVKKLRNFNSYWIKQLSFPQTIICDKLLKIWKIAQPRIQTIDELFTNFSYCFGDYVIYNVNDINFDPQSIKDLIELIDNNDFTNIRNIVINYFQDKNISSNIYYPVLNTIITGNRSCPPIFEIIDIIGKDVTRKRLQKFIDDL